MALNIFPRRREATEPAAAPELEVVLPEPSPEAIDEPRKRPRRGSRGGRGRGGRKTGELTTELEGEAEEETPAEEPAEAEAPAPVRRTRSRAVAAAPVAEPEDQQPAPEEAPAPARRTRARAVAKPDAEAAGPAAPFDVVAVVRSLEQQVRALEQTNRHLEQLLRQGEGRRGPVVAGPAGSAPPQRVGIFVDAANIELACDRLRARFDWAKVLRMLTQDRQLIRALAYSPVHDDPNVSIETQRFVEPFLDKGYKVVTKPLRRFQDGTVKANVDIEMALDVISMLDRLDVVVLISGDGDFQRLVEVCQSRGVRVEVAAVGSSTATNLKHAADSFIDLAGRLRDIRP